MLVGHSFSGMIVTDAGVHPNVPALVYVARGRRMPARSTQPWPRSFRRRLRRPASYSMAMKAASARRLSCAISPATCRKQRQRCSTRSSGRSTRLCSPATPAHAAWRSKPSYYAVSTEDRTINPDLERFMAKRMGAKTIELKSSHLSLIPASRRNHAADPRSGGPAATNPIRGPCRIRRLILPDEPKENSNANLRR